jgi:hypothetical protein
MKPVSGLGVPALVLLCGIALSSCANSLVMVTMPRATVHGAPAHRFAASFPHVPVIRVYDDSGAKQPQYGVGVKTVKIYTSGGSGPPTLDVSVESLTNGVPNRREQPFLRSYLPTSHGGRIIKWDGLTAATAYVPGCDPSGKCVGEVGSLVVLDGTTVYDVFTQQSNLFTAKAEIKTFRLIHK